MTLTLTQLYSSLSKKVGEETAENLTTYIREDIEHEMESKFQSLKSGLATKVDLAEAKVDLIKHTNQIIYWTVGIGFTILGTIIATTFAILSKIH